VAIPKLRSGNYFPDWLLERRRRAEAALTSVGATCYLLGVSTRRMEKLVEALGITRQSRSQVSEMARDLDGQVEAFRTRPLDAGPIPSSGPPHALRPGMRRDECSQLREGTRADGGAASAEKAEQVPDHH